METLDDREIDAEDQESKSVKEKGRPRKDKGKNKKLGCGLLSLSLLAIIVGIFLGLQLLGIVDVRPIIYKAGGHLPIVGQKFFPSGRLILSPEERRRQELKEYEELVNKKFLELQAKEEELSKKEQELAKKEAELAAEAERLAKSSTVTANANEDVDVKDIRGESFSTLVSILQEMSPRKAAQVLNGLSEGLAVEVLRALPSDVAGDILGRMDAAKAAALMEQLSTGKK